MSNIFNTVVGFFVFIYTYSLAFIIDTYYKVRNWLAGIGWFKAFYNKLLAIWPFQEKFALEFALIILVAVLLVVTILIICAIIKRNKKRTVTFIVNGKVYSKVKTRYKKLIKLPSEPNVEGYEFVGWFKDSSFKTPLDKTLRKKKSIYAYAKLVEKEEDNVATQNQEVLVNEQPKTVVEETQSAPINGATVVNAVEPNVEEISQTETADATAGVVEEIIDFSETSNLATFYDDIRFEMLGYERSASFKKMGVVRKHIIAEMFERDEKIYLYLAVSPEYMKLKGYNVESYSQQEFAIVPCKKVITTKEDADEAIAIIKEVMTLNNMVKSEIIYVKKTVSDEQTRKNGFAFYVKNDIVATTSTDYYRILRGIVLSYSASRTRKQNVGADNKMILKIFKKDVEEKVVLYLALDAEAEGLEFVGYDKNFVDTPAMFEVKTAQDCFKANELIDKLMYIYGMDKNPEQTEISLDDHLDANCGFGYRIRR